MLAKKRKKERKRKNTQHVDEVARLIFRGEQNFPRRKSVERRERKREEELGRTNSSSLAAVRAVKFTFTAVGGVYNAAAKSGAHRAMPQSPPFAFAALLSSLTASR